MLAEQKATERDGGDPSAELLLKMFRLMVMIRRFEEKSVELYKAAELMGSVHPAIGQEAVSVGVCLALRPEDTITTTHRGHGDAIAKGSRVDMIMAELFGRATGVCKGKGGSMHLADLSVGVVGANGIVCGGLPMTVGLALAYKLRGLERVAVAFFGDGATNQGAFHETLNMAALWSLPMVFACHNNQYATSVPRHKHQRAARIAEFAHPHGIPGVSLDGNDVVAVYQAAREAVDRARSGLGPTLLECVTYRWLGHHAGDNHLEYRSREEVESWYARDPIEIHRRRLVERDAAIAMELERVEREVAAALAAAVDFARRSPTPEPGAAEEDLFYIPTP